MPMATIEGTTVLALKRSPPDQNLQGEGGAGEEGGQPDDGQGEEADTQKLAAEFAGVERRADDLRQRGGGKDRQAAGRGEEPEDRAADRGEESLEEAEEGHAGSGDGASL